MSRRRPFRWWLLVAGPAVVIAASFLAVVGRRWLLTGDFAHSEFLVRAVPGHPPLVGVAARVRDNGSTPGPSMAYLLAPGYRLFGGGAHGLVASVATLHLAAIAAAIAATYRIAGRAAATAVALGTMVLVVALAPRFFLEPWNVWVPVFAFLLFVVLVWGVVLGKTRWILPVVLVGSHCVQTHIGYAPLVATGIAAAVGVVLVRWFRSGSGERPWWWFAGAGVGGLLMWLPPLIEQARPGTGNLRKIAAQFLRPDEPPAGIASALRAFSARMNLVGLWRVNDAGSADDPQHVVGLLLFMAVVVPAVILAVRRRERTECSFLVVLGGFTAVGILAASRVFGPFFEYVVRWITTLAALWLAAAVWSWARAGARVIRQPSSILAGALVLMVGLGSVGVVRASGAQIPWQTDSDLTAALADEIRARLDPGLTYQINEHDVAALGSQAFGIALELERRGWSAGVGPWGASGAMPHRVVTDERADRALWFVSDPLVIDAYARVPGAVVVASADPRGLDDRLSSDEAFATVVEELCVAGRVDLLALLVTRWGYTRLGLSGVLSPRAAAALTVLTDLRRPSAVLVLPVGAVVGALEPPAPTCG